MQTRSDLTVTMVDTQANDVIATIATGNGAHGAILGNDGKCVFIANIVGHSLFALNTATQKAIRKIKIGKAPSGITFNSAVR